MGIKNRSKSSLFALGAALVLLLVTVPVLANHVPPNTIPEDAGTLNLHLGSDGTYFRYSGSATAQDIGPPDRCLIDESGPLAAISGSDRGPGLVSNGIGIKTGGSQGQPCSQVDSSEFLIVELVGVPNASKVDLDLELKSNASIRIELRLGTTLVGTFFVRSGSSIVPGGHEGTALEPFTAIVTKDDPSTTTVDESKANCRNASDSGPDSGSRDNCRLTVDPDAPFDSIKFIPDVGEMSLEGSGDFSNNTANDTIFYLTSFDGVIGCTSLNNTVTDSDGDVIGTITRHTNRNGLPCVLKPFSLTASGAGDSIIFDVVDPVDPPQLAAYEFSLTLDQNPTNPLSANLEYDPAPPYVELDFVDMPWCTGNPFADPDSPGSIDSSVIPGTDTACIMDVAQNFDGTTTWHGVFIADIGIRGK